MIGALIATALVAGNDFVDGLAPWLPFALGQYLIGISIGARFKRESMQGLTRTLGIMLFMVLLMSALLAVYACFLVYLIGFSLTTAILLSSPGGMAEMALTANVLHLNVMLVTAFHFVRSLIVNAWALSFYKISERYHVFGWIEQRWDNLLGRSW